MGQTTPRDSLRNTAGDRLLLAESSLSYPRIF
jgi:hypothetical protein